MAMDLEVAEVDFANAIAQAMGDEYADGDPSDFEGFAAALAPALVAVLQHIIDNAETSNGGTIS
jgi:hypothetical protein